MKTDSASSLEKLQQVADSIKLPWPLSRQRDETVTQRFFRTRAMDTLPRTISHERVYIVPSRRGWAFVCSLLIMLIGAINYNLSLGYALCFLLTGLFSACLMATYRNLAGLQIDSIGNPEATEGEQLIFNITVSNQASSPRCGIDAGNTAALTRFDVNAENRAHAKLEVPALKRGRQPCGRMTFSSDYPLGLWFTWSYVHAIADGLVFPRAENSPPPLPFANDALPQGYAAASTQGEFESLREYQPGDSPGSIAWKTAARGMGMYTREFAAETQGSELVLDWQATRILDDTEARLSRLAAWAAIALQQEIPWSVELPGQQLATGNGEPHYRQTLRLLAQHGLEDANQRD